MASTGWPTTAAVFDDGLFTNREWWRECGYPKARDSPKNVYGIDIAQAMTLDAQHCASPGRPVATSYCGS